MEKSLNSGATVLGISLLVLGVGYELNFGISLILSLLLGSVTGLIVEGAWDTNVMMGVVFRGLMLFAGVGLIIKWLGLINSPPIEEVPLGTLAIGQLNTERRLSEFSVNLLWSDFAKRKKI